MATTATYRKESILGSALSGSDGGTNRAYSLSYSGLVTGTVTISYQGAIIYESNDFSISSSTITFLVPVFNVDIVQIEYYILTSTSATISATLRYASTLQLNMILGQLVRIPDWVSGSAPVKETVGTGNGSTSVFYLDYRNIVYGTYTIYYGASEAAATALTETTHYTINLDDGKITLTAAGITLVNTNSIYALYKYNAKDLSDSYLTDILLRAETEVDELLNTTYTSGSDTNPDYPSIIEVHSSQGLFNRAFFTRNKPLIDVSSTLASSLTSSASSLTVETGDGDFFPPTGTIVIGTEKLSYSSVSGDVISGLTRGVSGSTAAAHASADEVHTTVVESSTSSQGSAPAWNVLEWNSDTFAESLGKVFIYEQVLGTTASIDSAVPLESNVPNRFRVTYLYGNDTIPADIIRLTLLLAKRSLMADNVGKSMIEGRNEFRPEMYNADKEEIDRIVGSRREISMMNT